MKIRIFTLLVLTSLITVPSMVAGKEKSDREDRFAMELEIRSVPNRYTFQDYLSDLTESARSTDIDSRNPVRQREAKKNRRYEPLNPIVIRW